MYFSFHDILPVVWVCLGVALAAMIFLLTFYRMRTRVRVTAPQPEVPDEALPTVSVVVYARDNAADLRKMLPDILTQGYPADKFEVVVVNDGCAEEITDVVNYFSNEFKNLYITYVPEEARNLSRKKLSISLGIKAARHDVVLLTTARCRVKSPLWVRRMAFPFTAEGGHRQVVLGWARINGLGRSWNRFDEVARAVTWLQPAMHGHPYRGTGFNLAYRRDLFFKAKGFSRSLNLHHGDDDIFVNQITNRSNTAVVLSDDALVNVRFQHPRRAYSELRLRHRFTERRLPLWPRLTMGAGTCAMWVWLAAVTVGCVFSLPNWWPACLFAATIPALWIPLTVNWCRSGRALEVRLAPALLWWQMLWRWYPNLKSRYRSGRPVRRNYTWRGAPVK